MKSLRLSIWVAMFSVLVLFGVSAAQAPQAVIVVEAWSPYELHDLGWTTHPSTGLKVVGLEEQVYLLAKENAGQELTSVTWTLATKPNGSTLELDSTATARTTFRPDVEGQFVIDVNISTAGGASTASVTITSAKYVGVGTIGGAVPNVAIGQCGLCHSGNTQQWTETNHATLFTRGIDGIASDHYTESCIECHTVGFFEEVNNGGFWDVANQLGWQFPDTMQAGNWDDIVANYPALAAVSNIQCESCHGPGSQHIGNKAKTEVSLEAGLCGRCHDEPPRHAKNDQWKHSAHAQGHTFEAEGDNPSCAACHSGWGFVAAMDPASNLDQKLGNQNISCAVCHDPHDNSEVAQLRLNDGVALPAGPTISKGGTALLCMNCHHDRRAGGGEAYALIPTRTYRGPHHSNQTEMLFGVAEDVVTFGHILPNSTHKDVIEDACVGCHMAESDRADLGAHSWSMSTTEIVGNDTTEVDHVASCQQCHDPNMTSFDDMMARADHDGDGKIEAVQTEVEGLMHDVALLLPPYGEPTVNISDPVWNTKEGLMLRRAAWNYFFVEYDHSHGMHNYQFTVALLQITRDVLKFGALSEGVISKIADVPNDQGKQVRVTWTRFGGDGVSDNPVGSYAIWRRIDDAGVSAGKNGAAVNTLNLSSTQISELGIGTRLQINAVEWDYVGSIPATGQDNYNTVVPTVFDSTIAGGMKWSVFMVSGHTQIPTIYAVTTADSGYSVDNLLPTTPANLAGQQTSGSVALTWNEPTDTDFNYFSVYRSVTPNFDPAGLEPIGKPAANAYVDSDVSGGTTYYYRLSAVDFSGNESGYSSEFNILVTSTGGGNPIPETYALHQNYPNPFNPGTTIKFDLKEGGNVVLTVYNMLGEEVMQLNPGFFDAGERSIAFNGENLTSGIYFYKIQVNNFSAVKKMILMK